MMCHEHGPHKRPERKTRRNGASYASSCEDAQEHMGSYEKNPLIVYQFRLKRCYFFHKGYKTS